MAELVRTNSPGYKKKSGHGNKSREGVSWACKNELHAQCYKKNCTCTKCDHGMSSLSGRVHVKVAPPMELEIGKAMPALEQEVDHAEP